MTQSCLSCRRFTVKDRTQYERADKAMRAMGLGRCGLEQVAGRYMAAEAPRQCVNHQAITADQVRQRTAYLVREQTASSPS